MPEPTLNEVLRDLGYTTGPCEHQYKKAIYKDGKKIRDMSASDAWSWLIATGQYTPTVKEVRV